MGEPRENAQKSRPTIGASKTPWRKLHHLLISMHLKCKHRATFCVLDAIFRARSIRSSVRERTKSAPFPDFSSPKKTWPTKYDFGFLSSRTARCLSANRFCHKLLTRTTTCPDHRPAGHRNRTRTAIDLSIGKCFIHEALGIFSKEGPNKPQILLNPGTYVRSLHVFTASCTYHYYLSSIVYRLSSTVHRPPCTVWVLANATADCLQFVIIEPSFKDCLKSLKIVTKMSRKSFVYRLPSTVRRLPSGF